MSNFTPSDDLKKSFKRIPRARDVREYRRENFVYRGTGERLEKEIELLITCIDGWVRRFMDSPATDAFRVQLERDHFPNVRVYLNWLNAYMDGIGYTIALETESGETHLLVQMKPL